MCSYYNKFKGCRDLTLYNTIPENNKPVQHSGIIDVNHMWKKDIS